MVICFYLKVLKIWNLHGFCFYFFRGDPIRMCDQLFQDNAEAELEITTVSSGFQPKRG